LWIWGEALPLFQSLIVSHPSHRLTAVAYYWRSLEFYQKGRRSQAASDARAVRACLTPRPTLHSEWALDAKAALLLAMIGSSDPIDTRLYQPGFLDRQRDSLDRDLKSIL
jgi:hypothetical protein